MNRIADYAPAEPLYLDDWTQTIAGRPVRFQVLSQMFVRGGDGKVQPCGYSLDYQEGVVKLWKGLTVSRVAEVVAEATEKFCEAGARKPKRKSAQQTKRRR